jgi:hypothetical protein
MLEPSVVSDLYQESESDTKSVKYQHSSQIENPASQNSTSKHMVTGIKQCPFHELRRVTLYDSINHNKEGRHTDQKLPEITSSQNRIAQSQE